MTTPAAEMAEVKLKFYINRLTDCVVAVTFDIVSGLNRGPEHL